MNPQSPHIFHFVGFLTFQFFHSCFPYVSENSSSPYQYFFLVLILFRWPKPLPSIDGKVSRHTHPISTFIDPILHVLPPIHLIKRFEWEWVHVCETKKVRYEGEREKFTTFLDLRCQPSFPYLPLSLISTFPLSTNNCFVLVFLHPQWEPLHLRSECVSTQVSFSSHLPLTLNLSSLWLAPTVDRRFLSPIRVSDIHSLVLIYNGMLNLSHFSHFFFLVLWILNGFLNPMKIVNYKRLWQLENTLKIFTILTTKYQCITQCN